MNRDRQDLQNLRDFAVKRMQDANMDFDPTEVGAVINDYYESSNLIRGNHFASDDALFHAGISFRVSDDAGGARFGMQVVKGSVNKSFDDAEPVDIKDDGANTITHRQDYNPRKCAHRPLRESHFFITIDPHITYRRGKTPESWEYVGDNEETRNRMRELSNLLQYLFEHPDGIATWLVPVQSQTWGVTVDNLLRQQGPGVLRTFGGNKGKMKEATRDKISRIRKREDAVRLLEKDFYAFRMPQTCQVNQEEEEAKLRDPEGWIRKRIYSLQYATKLGVRKRYEQDHVLTYMANTHVIIKHYDRVQIDLHSLRLAINAVLGMGGDKGVYMRYYLRDNTLVHDFLIAYIQKTKQEMAAAAQEAYDELDVGMDLADVGVRDVATTEEDEAQLREQYEEPYVLIGNFFMCFL